MKISFSVCSDRLHRSDVVLRNPGALVVEVPDELKASLLPRLWCSTDCALAVEVPNKLKTLLLPRLRSSTDCALAVETPPPPKK
eukprot:160097-Chlamydomonas_euryale.AAC.2